MRPLTYPLIYDGAMESVQCAHHGSGNLLVAIQVKANQAWVVIRHAEAVHIVDKREECIYVLLLDRQLQGPLAKDEPPDDVATEVPCYVTYIDDAAAASCRCHVYQTEDMPHQVVSLPSTLAMELLLLVLESWGEDFRSEDPLHLPPLVFERRQARGFVPVAEQKLEAKVAGREKNTASLRRTSRAISITTTT